ncbi:MAG: UvrD-helicase domain-containing protein, partial [Oliverpabstia sp.]
MGVNWTKEQQQVIDLQNRNILVSAAAGSGKTAVLVERILKKMTRKENPVDIDRLLIVTFTRAAAGEMRERLTAAVEKRLEEDPDNEHLQRQQTLIYNAQITTIDGFCSYIIRNYFHTIDLDPGYRIANEGELKLLRMDVAKELLEARYAEGSPEFHQFIEVFATGKSDENIAELILKLYDFAMSNPWPQEWLESCKEPYLVETEEELLNSRWMEKLWRDVELSLEQAEFYLEQSLELLQEIDGPYMYEDALRSDKMLLEHLQQVCRDRDFNGCCSLLQNHKFAVLSRKKDDAVSDGLRQQTKENRDLMKEILKEVKERYFYGDTEKILQEMKLCRQPVLQLLQLTEDFAECFAEKKKKRNIVDFPDIEHYALEILVKKENGELIYTDAAEEFSQRFEEILIDEYQDSNLVQETLLQSVSRMRHGHNNVFMVGDVKQSIYRFRLARPELFMEKYDTYTLEDSPCQRIDLHRNFRSRKEVLAGVNYIFEQIMGK